MAIALDNIDDSTGSPLRNYQPDYSELQRRIGGTSVRSAIDQSGAANADAMRARLAGATSTPTTIADVARPSSQVVPINSSIANVGAVEPGTGVGPATRVYTPPPGLPAPDVTDVTPRPVSGESAIGRLASQASSSAGPLESAAMTALRRAAPAIAAIPEAVNTGRVAADPNSTAGDVAVQAVEGAGRVGSALAGAQLGGIAGAAIGGPAAPITGPIGALVGGVGGYFAGDQAIKGLRGALGLGPSPVDRIGQPAAGGSGATIIPGANGSTVQVNADGTSQLATRPTSEPPRTIAAVAQGAGAGRGQVNPPLVDPSQPVTQNAPTTVMGASAARAPEAAVANPFDGAVQIIRPGGQFTTAVQTPNGMVELDQGTADAYKAAIDKNPALAGRFQMTQNGPLIDGVAVPPNVAAAGDKAISQYIATVNTAQTSGLTPAQQLTLREQNLTHMLPANTPLDSDAGFGGLNGQPGTANTASGPEYLKTIPTALANQVKALAEGKMAFPSGPALKTPYWQNMMTAVSQYDPSFDGVNYGARAATRKDFTSGKSAQSINAMNTVAGHLESLSDAADKLHNTSYPMLNTVMNGVSNAVGNPNVKQFDATKKAVVDELTRVWRGNGGSEGDIKTWAASLDAANSPEQLHGVIGQLGELIGSKINSMGEQYRQGMGTAGEGIQLVTPKTQAVFEKLRQRAGGEPAGKPSSEAAPAAMPRKTVGGKTYENDGQGWYEVK